MGRLAAVGAIWVCHQRHVSRGPTHEAVQYNSIRRIPIATPRSTRGRVSIGRINVTVEETRLIYLPRGDVIRLLRGHYSPFLAPTDSCANPAGSLLLRLFTSFRESVQVATSPCCQRHLPDSISANLSPDAWSPSPTAPPSAPTCFFLDVSGLPHDTMGRLPVWIRERDFPAG